MTQPAVQALTPKRGRCRTPVTPFDVRPEPDCARDGHDGRRAGSCAAGDGDRLGEPPPDRGQGFMRGVRWAFGVSETLRNDVAPTA